MPYYTYITTNPKKTVLYIGITNNLRRRLSEHHANRGLKETFAGRYYCYILIYYEEYLFIEDAIAREKQLKKWSRAKKEQLIQKMNPEWVELQPPL